MNFLKMGLTKLIDKKKNFYSFERKLFMIYLILLIIEGALRKWIFPSLSTPLLVIRDPVIFLLIIQGFRKNLLTSGYVKISIILSFIAVITSMVIPHEKLPVIVFGARIFMLYIPCIFMVSKIITIKDIYLIGRIFIYLSIPMTILVILQFFLPQSAWVNRGVGGGLEGSGFGGAMGYYRPAAIFSFIQGYTNFQGFVCTFLIAYIFDKKAQLLAPIKPILLFSAIIMYLITIPLSISRTHLFQTIAIILFLIIALLFTGKSLKKLVNSILILILIIPLLLQIESVQLFLDVFLSRFESAQDSEGDVLQGTIGNRWFGAMLRPWIMDVPTWGYGIGTGTRVGISMITPHMITDEDWTRIVYESGILLGGCFILLRICLTIKIILRSFKFAHKNTDIMPLIFLPCTLFFLPQGPLGSTVSLGFTVIAVAFSLTIINQKNI